MFIHAVNSELNARKILEYNSESSLDPEVTFIVPVFDQESVIWCQLESIIQNSSLRFELIVINDKSIDNTHGEICRFFTEKFSGRIKNENFISATYYKNLWPWFETRCDDFCIRKAKSEVIIEIQADMLIRHKGFDDILKSALESNSRLCAISARGTHPFSDIFGKLENNSGTDVSDSILNARIIRKVQYKFKNLLESKKQEETQDIAPLPSTPKPNKFATAKIHPLDRVFPSEEDFQENGRAGWLGDLIELLPYTGESEASRATLDNKSRVWKGDTVMRGPLAVRREMYLELGGFNTAAFYQGNDDHDLFFRSRLSNYEVGFSPIQFSSPVNLGTARKKRKIKSKMWSKFHKRIRKKNFARTLISRKNL